MIGINNGMPINTGNHKLGDLYSNIYKHNNNRQPVNESHTTGVFSSTPFHKYLTDYDQMYGNYRVNVILKESYKKDVDVAVYLMQKNPELCNEIFGGLGQKIKQGVQAGAQAVQNKLIQPIINMIISKLPKDKQEALAKAAQGGEQALQQFIQQEGDPNVSNQVASQGAPVAESRDYELMHAYQILSVLTMDTSGVIREDAAQNKFKRFQKTLNQIASEIKDPNIQQQAQALSQYIQQNYTTRGTVKGAGKGAAPAPVAPATPPQPPATQKPAGPLTTGTQGGILPAPVPGTPPQNQRPPINVTPGGPQTAPTAQGGGSSLIGKIGSFIKNNPKLSAAAAIGLIGAIGVATGGLGFVTPMIMPALKSAGVGALTGAVGGAAGAKPGERLKGALKGAAAGGAAAGVGSLASQAIGGIGGGAPVDTGSEINPNAQSPESLTTPEPVDTGSEINPNAQSPESLTTPEGGESDEYTSAEASAPAPAQPTAPAAKQPTQSALKGAEQLQQFGNEAQAQKAAANIQPGEVLKKDTLGRTFRVKK